MTRIAFSILIMIAMFFPLWGQLFYFEFVQSRLRIRPNFLTLIDATVNFWTVNIAVVDVVMLLIFLLTVTEPAETRAAEAYRIVRETWDWGRYVLGTLAISNLLIGSYILYKDRDNPVNEVIAAFYLTPVVIAIVSGIFYLAWKIAFTLTGAG